MEAFQRNNISVMRPDPAGDHANTSTTTTNSSTGSCTPDKQEEDRYSKFVPKSVVEPGRQNKHDEYYNSSSTKNVCDLQQSIIISCLEKATSTTSSSFTSSAARNSSSSNVGGGGCNDAFAQWNDCIAKGYGYVPHS
mmetsp:Transcript_2413/g.4482  ORF Transcript_2413/g.4482 Transcript_2413/m.4482 type:complete len:137 (+) Transcript_2413:1330-1740(+)